jgi:putative hydrolase of the HAD superfamily
MRRWRAISFDLDDTLYPERDFVLSGFRAVARWADSNLGISFEEGFAVLDRLFKKGARENTFNQWLSVQGLDFDENLIQKLIKVYRSHKPEIRPFPEVPVLLEELRNIYKLGLVSDGYLSVQQSKLDALKLRAYFDVIILSDEWGKDAWKPDVQPFEALLKRLAINGEEAVYVADNASKDFLGANKVGMTTVWIRRAGGEYSHLEPPNSDHAPDLVFTTLREFEKYVSNARSQSYH